ncbi:MAG: sigma-70 family RNA polymerase sigma factor [Candidatus Eisenbacteria bacterium]|nr:sigma-70 family RNA polymerase sigma factor [Candidatus Latescibacterota bacterium]MBD3302618.1 sigma-70 family RNA polymerase sigma factor [Candidatus Eisenbacteria bacterium]
MEWITTTTLLRDLRDYRNDTAWNRFVQRFRGPILQFARNLGIPPDDAEEVAQETLVSFADAFRARRYDRQRGRLRNWLFGIAYNHVRRHRERLARRSIEGDRIDDLEEEALPDPHAATDLWHRTWERFLLEECIDRARREFSSETFRAFELVVVAGRTPAEAAHVMGVHVKTIYNGKHRVLMRIRELQTELEEVHPDLV